MTDLLCVFLPREAERRGFFLVSFSIIKIIDSSKKEERRKERQRGMFVLLDEIMLFVCYTSS